MSALSSMTIIRCAIALSVTGNGRWLFPTLPLKRKAPAGAAGAGIPWESWRSVLELDQGEPRDVRPRVVHVELQVVALLRRGDELSELVGADDLVAVDLRDDVAFLDVGVGGRRNFLDAHD